jgi:hypothetical protein
MQQTSQVSMGLFILGCLLLGYSFVKSAEKGRQTADLMPHVHQRKEGQMQSFPRHNLGSASAVRVALS